MKFDWLLRDSGWLTLLFFALVALAVFTQLTKTTTFKSLPPLVRAFIKAAPALFLAVLSWQLSQGLIAFIFLFCAIGDVFLDLPEDKVPHGFQIGALSFAVALVLVAIASCHRQVPGFQLFPLALTNIVIALFVLRWVFPLMKGLQRVLEVCYFGMLIVSNLFAATSTVPIFLGSSLWFMSDLSIGLGTRVTGDPANSLDTLGLYDLGLYFLAIGFLNI
jgi:YhhN family